MKTRLPLPVFAFLLPLFAFFLLLAAAPLHAQTWLGNGTTDWGTTTNWTPNTVPNSTTATATFNGTITSQPTIGASNYTVTNLTVGSASDNVTVSGSTGNLTLTSTTSSNLLTVAANKSLTLSSNVILASALTSGGQWFPNFTADAGSVIEFASGSTLTSTITSGTATSINYLLNGSGTYNFNGAFVAGNTTAFSMRGSGTLNWDPTSTSGTPANLNNTGTDGANINVYKSAGNLGFGTAGSGTRTMTIKNTGLTFGTTVTMGNATGAAGNPFKNVLAIDNGTAAGISVSLSALTLSSNATLGTNELFAGDNDTMTFTGAITRSAGTTATTLTKSGNGTVVFMGTNTYSDNTIVSAGVLSIASTASLPGWNTNGRYSVANGAALAAYNAVSEANITAMLGTTNFAAGASIGFDTTTADRTYTANLGNTGQGALGLVKAGANKLTLNGTNTYTGNTTITSGTLQVGNGSTTGSLGTGSVTNNATLTFIRSDAITQSGNITGTGSLTQAGAGTLTLSGNNTYTGNTTVTAGTLQIGHDRALGNSTTAVLTLGGGAVDVNGFAPTVKQVTATQNGTISGAGNLTLTSTTNSNLITVAAGKSLTISSGVTLDSAVTGSQWTPIFTTGAGSVVEFASGSTLTSKIVSGNATSIAYQLQGSGTYNFNGAFVAGNATTFTLRDSATLNWSPSSATANYPNLTNSGTDGAQLNVYKSAGALAFGSAGGPGTRTTTIRASGLTFANPTSSTVTMGNATGAGSSAFKNVLAIDDGTASAISVNLTNLNLTSNSSLGTNELFAGDSDTMRFSGNITRGGGTTATTLTKTGNGTVVFSGNNTYTDATNVTAGTLLANNTSGSATGSGNVTVASGATLGGNGTLGGATTISGIVAPGNNDIGTLNIANNVTWVGAATPGANTDWIFDLGASNTSDLLNIIGNFNKDDNGGAATNFRFDFNGSNPTGTTFRLVQWTGTSSFTTGSEFSYTGLSSGLTGSFSFDTGYLDFTLGAVPEPSTWVAMAALVLTGGTIAIRRRRQ